MDFDFLFLTPLVVYFFVKSSRLQSERDSYFALIQSQHRLIQHLAREVQRLRSQSDDEGEEWKKVKD